MKRGALWAVSVFGFLGVEGNVLLHFPSHHFILCGATAAQRFKPGVESGSAGRVQIEQRFGAWIFLFFTEPE